MRRLTAEQRYWQAICKARLQAQRNWRAFVGGKADSSGTPGMVLERRAIIAEIDRVIRASDKEAGS